MHIPDINTPERFNEFKQALNRALNTWDDGPRWLFDLSDKLEAVQMVKVSLNEKPKAKPSADSESLDTFDVQSLITVAENRARAAKAEHRAMKERGETPAAPAEQPEKQLLYSDVKEKLQEVLNKIGLDDAKRIVNVFGEAQRMVDISPLNYRAVYDECLRTLADYEAKATTIIQKPVVARTDNHVLVDVLQLKTIRNDITLAGNRLTMAQKILTDLIGDGA